MNKKILGGIAVLVVAVMAAFNVSMNTNSSNLSALGLANVEALAQDENVSCPSGESAVNSISTDKEEVTLYEEIPQENGTILKVPYQCIKTTVTCGDKPGGICCKEDEDMDC